jgi:hypothetical protein
MMCHKPRRLEKELEMINGIETMMRKLPPVTRKSPELACVLGWL